LPDQKLLASASDKVIMLWDLVSLTNVATLKAHQEDINILQKGSKILVSGGVSGFNNPGLYVWDLRASTPIEEREMSDVQCIEVLDDDKNAFIGNSAQLVKRLELHNGPSEALSPPHNDVVT
jgi:WD40 repeat protein